MEEEKSIRCLCAWYESCEVCDKPFPKLPEMKLEDYGKSIKLDHQTLMQTK